MQKKILSDQTLEELKRTEKKHKSIIKFHIVSFIILIGIAVFMTLENDISIYTVLPLFFTPIYIYSLLNLKKVKDEIKVRTAHIFLQKRMQDLK
ncbi:hypothetical protein OMO38_06900 [Chryseobacterium sp. 09-1422]|jgi:uncharacterized protein (DUF983 family)|uniref:Redox-active disulfide protein 2 n=1 Tax=Chryseobacterium kimseyorum TaxID=2984028 RepID=A0ABT3HWU5_9FLAO|nr:hypothetical protein [Chryseobacterium kimseyorum]MCW3168251.1 hypothetical protein [Chryseobacterium kimseyorum]